MGLYDDIPELARQFDPETGAELPESQIAQLELAEASALQEAEMFQQMCNTAGWQELKRQILSGIDQMIANLLQCNEFDEIRRYQARIEAYKDLLKIPELKIAAGQLISDEKQNNQALSGSKDNQE